MGLDLRLSESEEILKKAAMNFLKRDVSKETLEVLHNSDTGFNGEVWQTVIDMGRLGIITPEEYGGTGYPLMAAGILFEALGSAPLPGPYFSSGILGSLIIQEAGTVEQKRELLPQVTAGTVVLAAVLTESELGWQSRVESSAAGSGHFVLNGTKLYAPDALAATHLIVPARTRPDTDALSLFLLPKNAEGVSLRRLSGPLAGRSFELNLDSVRCPRSALLGERDNGRAALIKAIQKSIPVLCAYKVGGCQAVFDMAAEYSRVRVQFSQAIGRFQRVQDMIIEMVNQADAARWTTYEALWRLDTQGPVPESIHLAKAVASEAYWQSCNLAHRVISGVSYSTEHPLTLHSRTSRYLYNYLGEPAYHKQQLAKLLLS